MAEQVDLTKPLNPPDGTTAIVVKNPKGGGTSVRLKDDKGRFVRKQRPMPDGREIKRIGRMELMKMEADPETGKITKGSKRKFQVIFDNMYGIATNPLAQTDAKYAAASKQAADWIMLNFIGKPSETDEDKEDNKLAGIKFVLIQQPDIMHKEVVDVEDRFKEPEKPSFIDVEFVTAKDSDAEKNS
jgi:hypothetical protein